MPSVHRDHKDSYYQGREAQDGHLDFHTAPELLSLQVLPVTFLTGGELSLVHAVGLGVGQDEVLAGDVLVDGQVGHSRGEAGLAVAKNGDDRGLVESDPQLRLKRHRINTRGS